MIARKTLSLIAVVASACLPTFARTIVVQPQSVSPDADTEVSTNVVINKADISYSDLHFAFVGTPTNSLELAFGTDANTNGVLDAEEVETRFGWRNAPAPLGVGLADERSEELSQSESRKSPRGRYFIENALTCESFDSDAIAGSQSLSVELHLDIRSSPQQVRRIAVAGVNASAFAGILSGRPPAWL